MSSCFEDDTTLGTVKVGDIEIGELDDESVMLFVGKHVQRTPEVKHGYPEDEMSYAWYLLSEKEAAGHNYREAKRVANTKELDLAVDDHEWNLMPGQYTLVFEAKAANSYTQTATMTLTASTEFSEGFYILKETADGNSALDLITAGQYFPNLTTLPGKPLNLAVIYDHGHINENDELEQSDMVHVFTERDYRAFRTTDMQESFNRETLKFEPVEEDELPYGMTTTASGNICFSNKGYYEFESGQNTGQLGLTAADGDVKGVQALVAGSYYGCLVFWDNRTKMLCTTAEDIAACPPPAGFENADWEYLASGTSCAASADVAWFLCEDKNSGKRLLFQMKAEQAFPGYWFFGANISEPTVRIVEADQHLAKSQVMTGVGLGTAGIYVVDGGKIYLYNLESGEEIPVPLEGMEGEITYISNNFLNLVDVTGEQMPGCFNYLLVATRNGEGYNLYIFDELVSGIPSQTTPTDVKTGENGVVKHVRYCSNMVSADSWNVFDTTSPVYPFGD